MKKLNVLEITKNSEGYAAACEHTFTQDEIKGIKAGERMLVDSDGLALIYIIEDDEQFYYVSFGQNTWPMLDEAYKTETPLILEFDSNHTLELVQLHAELDFLLENIEGNSNYGEELETAVCEVFKKTV
ncbi:hypothetical protein BpOF4_01860 [Alkalihalophilus pseudofirmus OF4]|uniref:UPF0738 protein BpOF4_01860 n=1 Tax=Alkalihalophilus pseudofirmus (strain ATCC BAA-2126 / JCM 17055 / OF4) TaxID=398511 RepID=D3FV13_ALKPO|nr:MULTISPECIES: hypothetical protein [Alkalihalophilus]ADC48439.1 hypothetical protein BpOF4_01860 [Alkalihalophilus pseudofirmus OF4]MED1601064.1 hypothetical protein [Alkalihalophilus marmarensis]OLS39472.1 hypothetical protein BTR22_00965 [Alkalihalophilus pseudofirmus]